MSPRRHLSERAAERLLAGRQVPGEESLRAFVSEMNALVPDTAPTPSDQLSALLEQGLPVATLGLHTKTAPRARRLTLGRVSLAGLGVAGLVVGLAAGNTLPGPAQNAVADVVRWVSPIDLPHSDGDHPTPATSPSPRPSSSVDTEDANDANDSTGAHETPEPGDTRDGTGSGDSTTDGSSSDGATDGSSSGSGSDSSTDTSGSGGSTDNSGPSDNPTGTPSAEPTDSSGSGSDGGGGGSGPEASPTPTSGSDGGTSDGGGSDSTP